MSRWKDLESTVTPTFDLVIPDKSVALTPKKAAEIVVANIPEQPTREQVKNFEKHLALLPQVPLKPIHHFADGVYVRELYRPAGTVIVGKIHRKSHVFILHAGEITTLTERGMERLKAPFVESSQAGVKRLVVSHTDAVVMTVHPNPNNWGEADLDKLEAELTVPPESVVSEQ